jgi:DNA replicative helicase MCM subunit Mcm2 (Cdc46/Mcm family)
MNSKKNICRACTMIAAGVKFRKSPTHTCNLGNPKSIRFPKVDPEKHFRINVQRTGIEQSPNAIRVRCIKQEIKGIIIPNGFEIWMPGSILSVMNQYSRNTYVLLPGWKLNEVLKFLVMEGLRNG